MTTFEQIKEANESIKTTDIKGKDYAEVNQRVKAFRMVFPCGSVSTEIVSMADGIVTVKATVCGEEGKLLATGHAQEKEDSSYINKTSYIENCETSAVGRALGMCGFGIDTSICSAEELRNAVNNQQAKPVQPKQKTPAYTGDDCDPLGKFADKDELVCSECKAAITKSMATLSNAKYKKLLCPVCQPKGD